MIYFLQANNPVEQLSKIIELTRAHIIGISDCKVNFGDRIKFERIAKILMVVEQTEFFKNIFIDL